MSKKTRGNGSGSISYLKDGRKKLYIVFEPATYSVDGCEKLHKKQRRLASCSTEEEANYILTFYNSLPLENRYEIFKKEISKLKMESYRDNISLKNTISKSIKDSVILTFENKCAVCGVSKPKPNKDKGSYLPNPMFAFFHIHHIIPKSLGGLDSELNLVPLCPNCHAMIHLGALDISEKELREKLRVAINKRLS